MSGLGELEFCETDSDDQLPPSWEERVTEEGTVYYANHESEMTQWTHPVSGKKKFVKGKLPYGWERRVDEEGAVSFYDTINDRNTFTDPRLAYAHEEKTRRNSPVEFRQRFDGSSTALEVLFRHDLSDRYVIVTGANSGIGYETTRSLAMHGAHVVMACRDVTLGEQSRELMMAARKDLTLVIMKLDLASLACVRKFADDYVSHGWPIDVLILNAAKQQGHMLTENELESTIQVNYLSHFLLTRLLKDLLVANRGTRVIHLASESHRFAPSLDFNNLTPDDLSPPRNKCNQLLCYNLSKLCMILFSKEIHARWGEEYGLTSLSLHPGSMVNTGLSRYSTILRVLHFLVQPFTKSLQQACATSVYCAVAPELSGLGGEYFNNCCRCMPSSQSQQPELAKALWEISERILHDKGFL